VPSTHRAALTAIALALGIPPYAALAAGVAKGGSATAPVEWPSENSISNIDVRPGVDGDWFLDFDYAFLGKPFAQFRIELIPESGLDTKQFRGAEKRLNPPQPGKHHVSTVLEYPGEGRSVQIVVSLVRDEPNGATIASARIDKIIQWPTKEERDLRYATDAIGNGSREALREARIILERLVATNPKHALAYVELARIAMKSNWSPEGIHHAETLLDSALKISPQNVDAKILLGYVYTHQDRFGEAEKLFTDAARSNPVNVWLWTNWGEMFDKQGKADQAIAKYREAIARPDGGSRSHGARQNAYIFLLRRLEEKKDVDGMEALYKQRIHELGPGSCYSAEYARFKLYVRGDAQGAIDLARGALELNCDDAPSREILGLANYVQWAKGSGTSSAEALNQARIFLPAGATTLYLLARSEHTAVAAEKLIKAGERIDQLDNDKMTALAHALQHDKPDAAERLVRLGARPETPVSYAEIPAALLPVMDGNVDAIRLMQRLGVDYSKLTYRGASAIDYAKQMGDDELLKLLQPNALAL
jgi:tetratricopeptide (TPR) repeat protein